MKRVNKTKNNLQKIWKHLDKAYEQMEMAIDDMALMKNLSKDTIDDIEGFDITKISCLKNDIEMLLEEIEEEGKLNG
ncbi:MAG TPA: hypothetical protein VIM70_14205 [Clostridium sp.]|uniref:hypothetical protein n=1 Tax=Clostridium sp. TaxID=1506 RepID=UPI002F956458